jgi:4-amino-4-deoxy-L-arabinose transferase-like glycosyltransferase
LNSATITNSERPSIYLLTYLAIIIFVFASLLYAISQNSNYIRPLTSLFDYLRIDYTPIDLFGLFLAILSFVQAIFLGSLLTRTLLLTKDDLHHSKLLLKITSIGFGFAFVGLVVTVLSDFHVLSLLPLEAINLSSILVLVMYQALWKSRGNREFLAWIKSVGSLWRVDYRSFTLVEKVTLSIIGIFSIFVMYDSVFYPIVETDSIIYHASIASIAFYNHGLPIISGGGLGLGTSANYPLLFSYTGTYFYVIVGQVNDTFLKLVAPMMFSLSILTTFVAGRKLGAYVSTQFKGKEEIGRNIGSIAALLLISVPSFVEYGFQTTNETMLTFFVALCFVFLILSIENPTNRGYFVCAGISLGAACLTSYQGLYFVIPLILVIGVEILRERKSVVGTEFSRNSILLLGALFIVGATPYVRNTLIFHDPVYPFFTLVFPASSFSSWLFNQNLNIWRYTAYSLVSPSNPTLGGFLIHLISYESFYPLNLILVLPSIVILSFISFKHKIALFSFLILPSILILVVLIPFVRYFWLILPYAAISVAVMLDYAQRSLKEWIRNSNPSTLVPTPAVQKNTFALNQLFHSPSRILKCFLPIILIIMLVFPTMVLFANNNYTFIPFNSNYSAEQYFTYFDHPGISSNAVLTNDYGSDVNAWNWLSGHYVSGRIASFENRVYYMKFVLENPNVMYYLDASYSAQLYSLRGGPAQLVSYLDAQNISYVLVTSQDWQSNLLQSLPFTPMLGSPYFPLLYSNGISDVFGVGPKLQNDPIINDSQFYGYSYGLSNTTLVNGRLTRSVPMNNTQPRLFIQTNNHLAMLSVQYLDSGSGSLDFNVYNPGTRSWVGYTSIQKTNSGFWKNYSMIVPTNIVNTYTEFGLFARQSNFIISKISIENFSSAYRTTYGDLKGTLSNATTPESMMVYLPVLSPSSTLSITAQTDQYDVSLAIFKGFIPLNVTTNWWQNQELIAGVPSGGQIVGVRSPSLEWTAPNAGFYTLVIANVNQTIRSDLSIQISISIGYAAPSASLGSIPFG